MRKIILDAKKMTDKKITHTYLKQMLNLPEHYGENLDALWDCLSEVSEETKITINNSDILEKNLGDYGESIIDLFNELEECENYIIKLN